MSRDNLLLRNELFVVQQFTVSQLLAVCRATVKVHYIWYLCRTTTTIMTLLLLLFLLLLLLLLSSRAEANKSAPLSSIDYFKMSRQLADIVAIMDMDGYTINKKFLCKELGLKVGDAVAQSFMFDIGIRWSDLSPKDQRSSRYVQNHIHKLPFDVPVGGEAFPITSLEAIVRDLYQSVKRSSNSAIAYMNVDIMKRIF